MPNELIMVRRWQIVGAFILLVGIAVAVAAYNDHRINRAEQRISHNSARAQDLAEANKRQDKLRVELLQGLRRADLRACLRIEELKAQNRAEAQQNFDQLDRNLRLLGIPKTDEIVKVALEQLQRDLTRNAPAEC